MRGWQSSFGQLAARSFLRTPGFESHGSSQCERTVGLEPMNSPWRTPNPKFPVAVVTVEVAEHFPLLKISKGLLETGP